MGPRFSASFRVGLHPSVLVSLGATSRCKLRHPCTGCDRPGWYAHRPPANRWLRQIRRAAIPRSLRVLGQIQPASGGFLEAVPLTSFVVMGLASVGRRDHPVVLRGLNFICDSVRSDGSWPIDTNLATWNTTLAVNALKDFTDARCVRWLLDCQYRTRHPYTGADAGGWAWTDLSGGVPDVDDTSSALLALRRMGQVTASSEPIRSGLRWLLSLQNRDGRLAPPFVVAGVSFPSTAAEQI